MARGGEVDAPRQVGHGLGGAVTTQDLGRETNQRLAELSGGIAQHCCVSEISSGAGEQRRPLAQASLDGKRGSHRPGQDAEQQERNGDADAADHERATVPGGHEERQPVDARLKPRLGACP